MKLYLAGPMSGLPDFNFPAFDAAAAQLREAGHHVFNPADEDRNSGFDGMGMSGDPVEAAAKGFNLRETLKADLSWICDHAEGIALLPGWEKSNGARAEVALSRVLNIPASLYWYWESEPAIQLPPAETVSFKLGQGVVIEPVTV